MNQCPLCPFESKCETVLNEHLNTHDNSSLLPADAEFDQKNCFCDHCKTQKLQFLLDESTTQFPKSNIRVESEDLFPDEINEDNILVDPVKFEPTCVHKKWYKCDKCKYKTREEGNLSRHKGFKHGEGINIPWFRCMHCSYKSKLRSTLNAHLRYKHPPENEIQWYTCEQCDYKTRTKSCLRYHKFNHQKPENIQWFQCGHCDYKAKTRSRLNKHVSELHSNPGDIKWLKCEYCLMYITRRNSSLKLHIRRKHPDFLQ